MKVIGSAHERPATLRGTALRFLTALLTVSLASCTDDVMSPPDAALLPAVDQVMQRPFAISEAWDASDVDYTAACIADVPNPAAPGTSFQVVLGVLHASGTATHWGRHSIEVGTTYCSWDDEVGALDTRGPWQAVVASGDLVWGTYAAYGTFGPAGADFVGSVQILGGSGRFHGVSGESSLYTHDELDGSGWLWGSGWIAY